MASHKPLIESAEVSESDGFYVIAIVCPLKGTTRIFRCLYIGGLQRNSNVCGIQSDNIDCQIFIQNLIRSLFAMLASVKASAEQMSGENPLASISASLTEESGAGLAIEMENRMRSAGLETKQYLSVQGDEIYTLVRASESLLEELALKFRFNLECNPTALGRLARSSNVDIPSKAWMRARDKTENTHNFTSILEPYTYIWAPFDPHFRDVYVKHAFWKSAEEHSLFSPAARIKLINELIECPLVDGGVGLNETHLLDLGWAVFPLYSITNQTILKKGWLDEHLTWLGGYQPTRHISQMLGEEVALYFAFLGTLSRWLLGLGLVGAIVEISTLFDNQVTKFALVSYSFLVALWGALFTAIWKRRESRLSMQWGTSDFEQKESIRLKFIERNPLKTRSIVSGEPDYLFPSARERLQRHFVTTVAVVFAVAAVLVINVANFWLKLRMKESSIDLVSSNYQLTFSISLAVSISLTNFAYNHVANYLTEFENHRTWTNHNDSKIAKIFVVQFISSFGTLAYTAFIEDRFEGDCDNDGRDGCIEMLTTLVVTILVERLFFTICFDSLLPHLREYWRFRAETSGVQSLESLSAAEKEYTLDVFLQHDETIERFMDQVMLFGYMLLFVVALPLAPLLGFLSNSLQIQMYGRALLFHKQRNFPRGAQDIGTFQGCFQIVAVLAGVSNSGLIFFPLRESFFRRFSSRRFGNLVLLRITSCHAFFYLGC